MTTRDAFLGGRLTLVQPAKGFRAGMDSVILAAAIAVQDRAHVIELGSGAGVAALCLAVRLPGITVTGFEIQGDLVALANQNAAANDLAARAIFLHGDVENLPPALAHGSFDHAMMNPPFFVEGPAYPSPDDVRRTAAIADPGALARWTAAALKLLKPKGTLTAIVPADRLPSLLAALEHGYGGVTLFPLWPRQGEPAKRVLLRATKGSRAPFAIAAGLVLHGENTKHTPEAEDILRNGAALTF